MSSDPGDAVAPAGRPLRVAIADDGALFRRGLMMLLSALGHDVAVCVSDGDQLIESTESVPALRLDVAVLDVRMPPGPEGGLTTAARLRAAQPGIGLLLLSHHAEAHYLRQILRMGTNGIGYRLKDNVSSPEALSDAMTRLVAGEIVIEPEIARNLIDDRGSPDAGIRSLTPRETDVLRLMAEGRSNAAIAAQLFVAPKGIERHVAHIFTKLALPEDATTYHRRVLAVLAYLRAAAPRS